MPDCTVLTRPVSPCSSRDSKEADLERTISSSGDNGDEHSEADTEKFISKRSTGRRKRSRSQFAREGRKRSLANDRERRRVHEMSLQYQVLAACLPIPEDEISTLPRKTVLEEAMWYIEELVWMRDNLQDNINLSAILDHVQRPLPPSLQRHMANLKQREEVHNARKARRRERRRARAVKLKACQQQAGASSLTCAVEGHELNALSQLNLQEGECP